MEDLYEKALEAIREMFNDTSVSKSDAIGNLTGLREEIELLLDALENDSN